MAEQKDILQELEGAGVDPDTPMLTHRPQRREVFLTFEAQLSDMMPEKFFEYLWELAETISRPRSVVQLLKDQTHLHRLALDARSIVEARLARFEEITERLRDRYELAVRSAGTLGQRPTIDQLRATICGEHPDYADALEKLAVLRALKAYMQGLIDLCFSRQITAKERSERDRAHITDDYRTERKIHG